MLYHVFILFFQHRAGRINECPARFDISGNVRKNIELDLWETEDLFLPFVADLRAFSDDTHPGTRHIS